MKYTLAAAALLLSATAAGAATSSGTVWQGDLFIQTATSQCNAQGTIAGDFAQAVYAPMGAPGNNPSQDQLAIFLPRGSAFLFVPSLGGPLNKASNVNITTISSTATSGSSSGQPVTALKVSASVVSGFHVRTISFGLSNFLGISGCNVTISGTLYQRSVNLPD